MRTKNFKLCCFHGKLNPENLNSEAKLRNDLYLIGSMKLNITKNDIKTIRLIGYEVPLKSGASRVNCIDLLGYDQNYSPYIIELKKSSSTESLSEIINQVNNYETLFNNVKPYIEKEFRKNLHWKTFVFSDSLIKIILVDRDFYGKKENESLKKLKIGDRTFICSFSRVKNISTIDKDGEERVTLLEKCGSKGYVNLRIHNK